MLKQLFLVSMLCTAPTLYASQEEQDAYQYAQLCLVTAVAAFSLVYVLGKKCFDKPAPAKQIVQTIPTQPILKKQVKPKAAIDSLQKTISDTDNRPHHSPHKTDLTVVVSTIDLFNANEAWNKAYPETFPKNRTQKIQFASNVETISPTKEPEQEPVPTRVQIMQNNTKALQQVLLRKKTKPT